MGADNDFQVWLTKAEAAERLRVSTRTIDRLTKTKELPSYRHGTGVRRRFRVEDVDALLEREP